MPLHLRITTLEQVIFDEEVYDNKRSFYVVIVDDGKGISDGNISSVMDFGAEREYR